MIVGSYLGVHLAVWCNFQLGLLRGPPLPPPYPILWPTFEQYGHTLLRMAVGGVILLATRYEDRTTDTVLSFYNSSVCIRAVAKPITYFLACMVMGEDPGRLQQQNYDIRNHNKIRAELSYKFLTYLCMGFNTMFVAPIVFEVIGIERSTFYTEV